MIDKITCFTMLTVALTMLFIYYGMDIRRKEDSRNLAPVSLQWLTKVCSFALIGVYAAVALRATTIGVPEWIGSALLASGVLCIALAKRALGRAHRFTGQCLAKPSLVATGIYRVPRMVWRKTVSERSAQRLHIPDSGRRALHHSQF